MIKECIVTKKRNAFGKKYCIRGIAKKKKGIGLKTTSIVTRKFKVNFHKKNVWSPLMKRFYKVQVSAKGLKALDLMDVSQFVN